MPSKYHIRVGLTRRTRRVLSDFTPKVRSERRPFENWRTEFFYELHFGPHMISCNEAVRAQKWKYIRYFNSEENPFEAKSLATLPEHKEKLEEMRTRWWEWREVV